MFRYLLRRIAYSLLILLGVMMLTFALFRVAAGDPAATMLGKKPTPREVEEMRDRLGSDRPLFFGAWRTSEQFTNAVFAGRRSDFIGVTLTGPGEPGATALKLPAPAELVFQRNFERSGEPLLIRVKTRSPVVIAGQTVKPVRGTAKLRLDAAPDSVTIRSAADGGNDGGALIEAVRFLRPTRGLWDSQLTAALQELVSFHREYPYVRCFNFGVTLQTREPIRARLWRGMWPSLFLMLPVFFGELLLGITLAMAACVWRGTWLDRVILLGSVAGMSISYLALIIFGQWFLAYYLNWFPVWGWGGVRYLALPVLIGILSGTGGGVRFYRTVFLNEMNKEYLRTAFAKGVPARRVWFRHLLRNALVPIITRASGILPFLFTGSLLLESFFGIPGLGYEGVAALNDSDLQMLKALVILGALLFVIINLLTDLAYAWADPRMRPDRRPSAA